MGRMFRITKVEKTTSPTSLRTQQRVTLNGDKDAAGRLRWHLGMPTLGMEPAGTQQRQPNRQLSAINRKTSRGVFYAR